MKLISSLSALFVLLATISLYSADPTAGQNLIQKKKAQGSGFEIESWTWSNGTILGRLSGGQIRGITLGSGLSLSGDGVLSSSGGISSIGLSVPTGFSASGPLTANGSISVTTSLSGIIKGTGSGFAAATAGTDFLAPNGSGASLTGITAGQISGLGTLATQSGTFSGTSSGINTGDQTITLSGDISGSGTGAITATIGADKVTASMLAGSIPDSKLSTISTAAKVANSATTATAANTASAIVARDTSGNFKMGQLQDGSGNSSVDVVQRSLDDENGAHAILWDTSNCSLRYGGQTRFDWKNLKFPSLTSDGFIKTTGSNGTITVDTTAYVPTSTTVNGHALSGNISVTKTDLSLGSVEDTALSTWAGSSSITTLGTITTGTWTGAVIGSSYGGAGTISGIMKANGSGGVSAATAGTDYLAPSGSGTGLSGVALLAGTNVLTGQNTFSQGSIATSKPFVVSQTWDDGGAAVNFSGLKVAITDTRSNITDEYFTVYAGPSASTKVFGVEKLNGANFVRMASLQSTNYTYSLDYDVSGMQLGSARQLSWSSTVNSYDAADLILKRPAPATLQMGSNNTTPILHNTQVLKAADVTTAGQGASLTLGGGRGNGTNSGATGSSGGPIILSTQAPNPAPVTVTASTSTDQLTGTAHGLLPGAVVRFTNSGGAIPTGLAANTSYYAISANQTASTFMVSSSLRGNPKVFTTSNVDTTNNTITVTAHGYTATPATAGTAVRFMTAGTLPAPLALNTTYWVIASGLTSDVFKVAATPTGSAIDITTTGTGDHTVQQWEGAAIDITGTGSGTTTVTTYEGLLVPRLEVSPPGQTIITASNSQASSTDGSLLVRSWNSANNGYNKMASIAQLYGVYNGLSLYDPSGNPYAIYAGYSTLALAGGVPVTIFGSGGAGIPGLSVFNSNGVQRYFVLANNNLQYDWLALGNYPAYKTIPAGANNVIHQTITGAGGATTDIGGNDLTVGGGPATGSSAKPGSVILATALPGGTSSLQGFLSTRRYDSAQPVDLSDNVATNLTYISCGAGKYVSVVMNCTVYVANSSSEYQVQNSDISFSVANKDDSTVTISTVDTTHKTLLATSGTLTPVTYTVISSPKTYTLSSVSSNYVYCTTEHRLRRGDMITFSNSGGALPTGISAATQYYVRDVDGADLFKISTTANGSAIAISGGTGTTTISCAGVLVKVQADTSLTPTTMTCKWTATTVNSNGVASFFPLPVYSPQN